MSNLNIAPQTVLLTSGQAVTFEATDATGKPALVTWSLNPVVGDLVVPTVPGAAAGVSTPASSATYVAPSPVGTAQTIAIVARTATDAASATISLTTIAIVPSKVDLSAGQTQQFSTIVGEATAPAPGVPPEVPEKITWTLSPPLGTLDQAGLYTSPREILDSTAVNVIVSTPTPGKRAMATVNLAATPWQGLGVDFLGGYLLLVFSLVFLIVGLWPPILPSPDSNRADRMQAEKTLEDKTKLYNDALAAAKKQTEPAATPSNARNTPALSPAKGKQAPPTGTGAAPSDGAASAPPTVTATAPAAGDSLDRAGKALDDAESDLKEKRAVEKAANDTNVKTWLVGRINRELDLIFIVLLGGALGSFLHTAQSYSDYVGNRTLKKSWAWWYSLRPFIGAGLALVFYAAIRGGFLAITVGSKNVELNPFGVVSIAAMVGMFSKAATTKLGELFDTLFKTDKAKDKDPVTGAPQGGSQANQSGGKPAAGGTATSTGAK
jgi:hypothetical protein